MATYAKSSSSFSSSSSSRAGGHLYCQLVDVEVHAPRHHLAYPQPPAGAEQNLSGEVLGPRDHVFQHHLSAEQGHHTTTAQRQGQRGGTNTRTSAHGSGTHAKKKQDGESKRRPPCVQQHHNCRKNCNFKTWKTSTYRSRDSRVLLKRQPPKHNIHYCEIRMYVTLTTCLVFTW